MFTLHLLHTGGGEGDGTPSTKLFVRNLSYETDASSLEGIFTEANDIFLPKDKETGEPRGYVGVFWSGCICSFCKTHPS